MKFEVGTEAFNNAVNRVYKGVGNMGLFMITSVIGIEGKDGDLILTSTDNSRNVEVKIKNVLPKDAEFYTATKAALLKALVNKTDSALITIEILDDRLVFTGDCSANLEVINNDEGTGVARINKIYVEGETTDVKVSDLKKFITYLKCTVAQNLEVPAYSAYRVFNGKAMTFDNYGSNLIEIDWNADILIPPAIVNMFELLEDDVAKVTVGNDKIKVETSDVVITGALRKDKDKYATERFLKVIYSEQLFNTQVVIDKQKLTDTLDRLSLFINIEKEKAKLGIFNVEVSKDSMLLISKDNNFVEKVPFESSNLTTTIEMPIGITIIKKAISSIQGDKITVNFGEQGGMRFVEDKAYLVIPYAKKVD